MTAKFTKGPWRIESRVRGDFIFASEERLNAGFNICKVSGPESSYNASLIACAPEMYEMLERVARTHLHENSGLWIEVTDLLKKARGEV